jgi:hypothetical protein
MTKAKIFFAILFASSFCFAQKPNANSKSVNMLINGLPAQYTSLRIDTLSRCIQNLPDTSGIVATSESRAEYLRRIAGSDKSDYVRIWDAKVHLIYQWKYKFNYLLMPQGGLDAQAPIFHETEGTTPVSETITGDPQEGDFFAFSNPRRYYFNSQEAALNSAAKRAKQRILELRSLRCSK